MDNPSIGEVTVSSIGRPGAIPPSMIPTPIPAHLFDSDSSHLGYDSNSDSDSNTIFMNDSDSDSDSSTPFNYSDCDSRII